MRGAEALKTLRERRDDFDIVLSDVHMPDMDGFKLLEHIALELDVPVMSAYPRPRNLRSPRDGFPVRPARPDPLARSPRPSLADPISPPRARLRSDVRELRHRCRPARHHPRRRGLPPEARAHRGAAQHLAARGSTPTRSSAQKDDSGGSGKPAGSGSSGEGSKGNKGSGGKKETKSKRGDEGAAGKKRGKKDRDDDAGGEEHEDASTLKKPRVVWSAELHQQFVTAVNQLGIDKAVPKRILDLMGVQGLTRENVASHLQKYRLYLKRLQGVNSGGGSTGGSGFVTGLPMEGGANVMGPSGGRVGSPAVGAPGGAPGMVMGGHMDHSAAGGVMQPAGMMSGGMMYSTGARNGAGAQRYDAQGCRGGTDGRPTVHHGGGTLTAGFPGVVSRSSWARGCSPEWAASARGR